MASRAAASTNATAIYPSARRTGWVLFGFDLLAVISACLLAIFFRYLYDRSLLWELYADLWPISLMFVVTYALSGLYPGVGITVPEELRRLSYGTSLVFILAGASTFMYRSAGDYSRGVFVFAWVLALFTLPLGRALARELFARKPWWGAGVVILGAGEVGQKVTQSLVKKPSLGLKPLALLDDDPSKHGLQVEGVRVEGNLEATKQLAKDMELRYAIVAMPGLSRQRLLEITETHGRYFPHLIVVPDLLGFSSLWVSVQDLGGTPGLEIRQRLLVLRIRLLKRVLDMLLFAVVVLPFLMITSFVALLIRLDSPGPVFYRQERLGMNGRRFQVIKFRTMYGDGEARLKALLEQNPDLKREYEEFHKLRDDPRVTRVGRLLRKLSLDELPQVWNVLRGEMSMVGPRAYLPREETVMGESTHTILRVLPGITGLWQVSGRNELSFAERINLDVYYVRNWSVWLDLYILARTVGVVLFGKGAY
ncbi:MAG: undecaprenyl-phosphate galactose phosphotransferase WbaP [Thermaceae bacterium]|nr:undecaprenyl-phosphate galactose phosphotransferase WbaP [Thermaceae bacterium]